MTRKITALPRSKGVAIQEVSSREKILDATTELLAGSCLHSISIRDIANAAGVNSALISYYFGSKEQLYEAVIQYQFDAYKAQVAGAFKNKGDVRKNLQKACNAIVAFHATNPCWLTLYFRELTNPSSCYAKIILPCIADASRRATAMVQAGIDQGIFRPDINPRFVVQSFVGMLNYCFMTCRLQKDLNIAPAADIDSYLSFALEMILKSVSISEVANR